ncbi:hypothetical protein B0J12DRAFT_673115 [Macrophomina phaseolina]|uniref:D-isomer specific 2-hydroxyacid dehydrogenase NAD-binding domain-containing protein n=1 Tax=Macrophomina phaseolina TaxID=35725 RepID=A0ABQ8G2K4_9PEZI|nr:hypothetical protein B0J12DRAFT_673115 [Macrophomina phaseolina]
MIGASRFSLMKDLSILINTSRGAVVDEDELIKALESGKVWRAGPSKLQKGQIGSASRM